MITHKHTKSLIYTRKIFFLVVLLAIQCNCDQSIQQQLEQQNILFTIEDDKVFKIVGQENNYNIKGLSLTIESNYLNLGKRIEFSSFNSIQFLELNLKNNILDGSQQSPRNPLLSFLECESVMIDDFNLTQSEEDIFGQDMIHFYQTSLLISKGKINYIQAYQQTSDITKIISVNNIDREDYSIQLRNFTFNIIISSTQTNIMKIIDLAGGKSALIEDFIVTFKVDEKVEKMSQFTQSIISLYGFQEKVELKNFQFYSNSTFLIFPSLKNTPLISIDSCPTISFENIRIQYMNVFFFIMSISNSKTVEITNIYLHDTFIRNNNYDQIAFFFIREVDTLNVHNIYIRDIKQIELIEIFYLQKINNALITNLNFSKNESIQYKEFVKCELTKNLANSRWTDRIFVIEEVNNIVFDSLNICGLASDGNVRGLLAFLRWTLPFSQKVTLKNINQYMQGSNESIYNARLLSSVMVSRLDLKIYNYSLIINNEINHMVSSYAGLFYIVIDMDGELKMEVDSFYVNVTNPYKKDNQIPSSKGTFFTIQTPSQGNYTTIFRNMSITGITGMGVSGFAYIEAPNFIVENSYFKNVKTQTSGGVFYITSLNVTLKNTTFDSCSASFFGGAIVSMKSRESKYQLFTDQLTIKNCSALIGAGIYGPLEYLAQNINYQNNKALLYGDNYSSYITKLEVPRIIQVNSQMEGIFNQINQTTYSLKPQRNTNLYTYMLEFDQVYTEYVYYIQLQFSVGDQQLQITNTTNIDPTQLNLSKYLSYFTPSSMLDQTSSLNISQFHFFMQFQSLPEYPDQILQTILFDNFQFLIMTQQNKTCTDGQIRRSDGICEYCDTFSCTDRENSKEQTSCFRCSASIHDTCYGYYSYLKQGYIRYSYSPFQNHTYYCAYAPQYCIGGSEKNDQLCESSHVGPECAECVHNQKGDSQYVRTQTLSCIECNDYLLNYTFFILLFFIGSVLTWIFYQNISNVKEQMLNNQNNNLTLTNSSKLSKEQNNLIDIFEHSILDLSQTNEKINIAQEISINQDIKYKQSTILIDENFLQTSEYKSDMAYSNQNQQHEQRNLNRLYVNEDESESESENENENENHDDEEENDENINLENIEIIKNSHTDLCFSTKNELNLGKDSTITLRNQVVPDSCIQQRRASIHIKNQSNLRLSKEQIKESTKSVIKKNEEFNQSNQSILYLKMLIFYLNILYFCSFNKFIKINQPVLDSLFLFQINIYNPFIGSYFSYFKCFFIQILPLEFESPQHLAIIILGCLPIAFILIFLAAKLLYHPLASFFKLVYYKIKRRRQVQDQLNYNLMLEQQQEQQMYKFELFNRQNFIFLKQFLMYTLFLAFFQQIESLLQGIVCMDFEGYGKVTLANLVLFCDNSQFQIMRVFLIVLLIFYFFFIISSFIIRVLLQKREVILGFNKLDFYFMHSEYKEEYYYWELSKSTLRMFMVAIIFIFPLQNQIIGFFILIILGIYTITLVRNQPYSMKKYFKLELYLIGSGFFTLFIYMINSTLVYNENENPIFIQDMLYFGNYQSCITVFFLTLKFIQHYFKNIFEKSKLSNNKLINCKHQICNQ